MKRLANVSEGFQSRGAGRSGAPGAAVAESAVAESAVADGVAGLAGFEKSEVLAGFPATGTTGGEGAVGAAATAIAGAMPSSPAARNRRATPRPDRLEAGRVPPESVRICRWKTLRTEAFMS